MDAARYLQDRADDAECGSGRETRSSRSRSTYSSTTADETATSTRRSRDGRSTSSVYSSTTASSDAKKSVQMAERKKLRESLENLVTFFARRADETGDREWSVITGIAERLLFDVSECIQTEQPLGRDLITRIKGLKKLAKEATMKATGGAPQQR
ncbi:hypothetical protein OESDEN_20602 [Oesophagostomum dentatum]|uniref:Uncharacterized protein n=1 Tax=Oesophagostomum dentatum TaxID=61180 RepID=A0A0B1S894_OESDE|nr:hypothetical protein OESDEN_20602 [Oesophagostomum dentatum]